MNYTESAFAFECQGDNLIGIAVLPEKPVERGVLVIVGGPQYRTGSHRQFALMTRYYAAAGIPAMRFDYRGMGDSEGELRDFESIGEDIQAAVDAFFEHAPGMKEVILWGLCDAATAAIFHAWRDSRISGLVLVNPWARTEDGEAKARLKHYYLSRIVDPGLWRKLIHGKFDFRNSLTDFFDSLSRIFGRNRQSESSVREAMTLPERMREGLEKFKGKSLLILSENDLTAREFEDIAKSSTSWRKLLEQIERRDLAGADHTFSCRSWRDQVSSWTKEWILEG